MSEKSLTTRVGIFVLLGLVALAVLLLNFSKTGDWFEDTYILYLRTSNVSGIKPRAAVLMAGVPVGYVHKIELSADGRSVILTARIYSKYLIRRDSVFAIEQSGFLGDQYVAIAPRSTTGGFLQNGDVVKCLPPFDLQDTARRASDLLDKVGSTLTDVQSAFSNIQRTILSGESLTNYHTNLLILLDNARKASDWLTNSLPRILTNAEESVKELRFFVTDHTNLVSQAISNFHSSASNLNLATASLGRTSKSVEDWVNKNSNRLDNAAKNIEITTQDVTNLISSVRADLDAGKGLLGGLLRDETMRTNAAITLEQASLLSSNLNVAAGNLNRFGLWWMLWKPKYPKTNTATSVKSPAGRAN